MLDCIDQVRAKAALIAHCRKFKQFIVTSGAAGGRVDPSQIRTGDLGRITGDPLLSSVRYRLRKAYGFPKASPDAGRPGKPMAPLFRVASVYSAEPVKNRWRQRPVPSRSRLDLPVPATVPALSSRPAWA